MRDYQFGNFIFTLRTENNLSQSKLGALVGVSNKAVSKWENGASKPSMETLVKLSEIFHVSIEELLAGRRLSDGEHPEDTATAVEAPAGTADAIVMPGVAPEKPAGAHGEAISSPTRQPRRRWKLPLLIAAVLLLTVIAAAIVLWWSKPWLPPADVPTPQPTLDEVMQSVVKIETDVGTGSGFCTIREDWIITNYHVIKGAKKIYTIDDRETKKEVLGVVLYDEKKDLAILRADDAFSPLPLGDGNAIRLKEDITVIGSPKGVLNTVSVGIISNTSHDEYIVISAPASPGSSGGVLLNDRYQVIGIVKGTANDEFAQNLNFAINVEKLKTIYHDYNTGIYDLVAYPPTGTIGAGSTSTPGGGSNSSQTEEIPMVLSAASSFQFLPEEKLFRMKLTMISNYGQTIAANVDLQITITNTEGEVVYSGRQSIRKSDYYTNTYMSLVADVDIPTSEFTAGSCATGSASVVLLYQGKEIDSATMTIERGLPIAYTPFETLHYSGDGVGAIAGVNLPYGTYNIIFTHAKDGFYSLKLGNTTLYSSVGNSTSYVSQLKPAEDNYTNGTPLKNAVFNITNAQGPWTLTIERVDPDEANRIYQDGMTYTGVGPGYVKDIYLPVGTYFITLKHSGKTMFEVDLNGYNIYRRFGEASYVYILRPDTELAGIGTPILSAYFNILEAGGAWSITIERADTSTEDKIYEDGVTYRGTGVGHVKDVYLPEGTYYLLLTHAGTGTFHVECNGQNILQKHGKISYVFTLKPDAVSHYISSPFPLACFNIMEASGDWTLTIEQVDTSAENKRYVDGVTYTGVGCGYIKDIYLPEGTYNITFTHEGTSLFEAECNGRSLLCQVGRISYIYTLHPTEGAPYFGAPLVAAVFNILSADGAWSITIHRVE